MAAPNPFLTKQDSLTASLEGGLAGLEAEKKSTKKAPSQSLPKPSSELDWLRHQLKLRGHEFSEQRYLTAFLASLNANGKKPRYDIDLSSWLLSDVAGAGPPDIYAIGFQEIVDLNASNMLVQHTAAKPWADKIEECINPLLAACKPKDCYVQLACPQLVGLSLLVYARKSLLPHISDVRSANVGVGLMGMAGNKGAVAVRFNIFDSSLCFVNAHLAAQQKAIKARNSDFHSICSRLVFPPPIPGAPAGQSGSHHGLGLFNAIKGLLDNPAAMGLSGSGAPTIGMHSSSSTPQPHSAPAGPPQPQLPEYHIFDHSQVFWIGDLNYRLNLTNLDAVLRLIEQKDWPRLLQHDQLTTEKALGNAFVQFTEGPINFAPTYKYEVGSNEYECLEGKKKRAPAWTDRIQWNGHDIRQAFYSRAELTISDHKPVMTLLEFPVRIVIKERRSKLVAALKQLAARERVPEVLVSATALDFKEIHFDTPVSRAVRVRNPTKVAIEFKCYSPNPGSVMDDKGDAHESQATFPPWLLVHPLQGVLQPGAETQVQISVHVSRRSAHALNSETEVIASPVVLGVTGGEDYVLSVRGVYLKSCFGASLDFLCRLSRSAAVRSCVIKTDVTAGHSPAPNLLPACLFRMVHHLTRNRALAEPLSAFPAHWGDAVMSQAAELITTPGRLQLNPFDAGAALFDPFDPNLELCSVKHADELAAVSRAHSEDAGGRSGSQPAAAGGGLSDTVPSLDRAQTFNSAIRAPTDMDAFEHKAGKKGEKKEKKKDKKGKEGKAGTKKDAGEREENSGRRSTSTNASSHSISQGRSSSLSEDSRSPQSPDSQQLQHSDSVASNAPSDAGEEPSKLKPLQRNKPRKTKAGQEAPGSGGSDSGEAAVAETPAGTPAASVKEENPFLSAAEPAKPRSQPKAIPNGSPAKAAAAGVARTPSASPPANAAERGTPSLTKQGSQDNPFLTPSGSASSVGSQSPATKPRKQPQPQQQPPEEPLQKAPSQAAQPAVPRTKSAQSSNPSTAAAAGAADTKDAPAAAAPAKGRAKAGADGGTEDKENPFLAFPDFGTEAAGSSTAAGAVSSGSGGGSNNGGSVVKKAAGIPSYLRTERALRAEEDTAAAAGTPADPFAAAGSGSGASHSQQSGPGSKRPQRSMAYLGASDKMLAELQAVCEWLDTSTGAEFNSAPTQFTNESVARALVLLLDSLHEPLLNPSLPVGYAPGMDLSAFCCQVLMYMAPLHYKAFVYIVSFLRQMLAAAHASGTGPTAEQLAVLFASCLTQQEPHAPFNPVVPVSSAAIVRHLLTAQDLSEQPSALEPPPQPQPTEKPAKTSSDKHAAESS